MSKKIIAVLITCHNRRNKTLSCLKSLYNISLPQDYEINVFLVDDGSTDGTSEAVKSEFPIVNLIQGTGDLYWNRGMHLAWKTAVENYKYDFYLWLNDDVILFNNSLETLLQTSDEYKDAIIAGSMCAKDIKTLTYGAYNKEHRLIEPTEVVQECTKINGNVVLIPDSVFNVVGNLNPKYPHTIGDYDYSLRASKYGFRSFITPGFIGICEANPSLPKWCLPEVSISNRIKSLYSPLGNSHPYYYFIFEKEHYGIGVAIKHFFSIHLRLFFPKLWKLMKR